MSNQILLFHDDFARSHANRALAEAVRDLPDTSLTDMGSLYKNGGEIDVDREVARLLSASRLVLQFPVQWYSTPPLLKAWQDRVLTRMYYINPKTEGDRLAGLPVLVAATAGNVETAYTEAGMNLFPLADLLRPLEATAHRCGWQWADPFLVYRSNKLDDIELADAARGYRECVSAWVTQTTNVRKAA